MTKFKVGDKVRINGLSRFGKDYIGKVGEVRNANVDCDGNIHVKVDGYTICILPSKVELVSPEPTKNQRITTLEQKVEAMQAEIDALKAAQKPKSILSGEGTLIFDGKPIAKVSGISYKTMTPNEQRKAIIDEAKAFVEELTAYINPKSRNYNPNHPKYGEIKEPTSFFLLKAHFVVKSDKNEVTCVLKGGYKFEDVKSKAIAKCNPSDVFNADIGKAIALGRALGLDVERFEKAVQPSEVVTGMHVDTYYIGSDEKNETCPTFVTHVLNGMPAFGNGTHSSVFKITDDTEAQY